MATHSSFLTWRIPWTEATVHRVANSWTRLRHKFISSSFPLLITMASLLISRKKKQFRDTSPGFMFTFRLHNCVTHLQPGPMPTSSSSLPGFPLQCSVQSNYSVSLLTVLIDEFLRLPQSDYSSLQVISHFWGLLCVKHFCVLILF